VEEIKEVLHTNSNSNFDFVQEEEINPVFCTCKKKWSTHFQILGFPYESKIDKEQGSIMTIGKNYDEVCMLINKKLGLCNRQKTGGAPRNVSHYY